MEPCIFFDDIITDFKTVTSCVYLIIFIILLFSISNNLAIFYFMLNIFSKYNIDSKTF